MRQRKMALKRALMGALFFFLSACESNKGPEWYSDCVSGSDEHAVLTLTGSSAFKDLEIEVQRTGEERRIYLNAYGLPFQPDAEGKIEVQISIDDKTIPVKALVLKGNQSLKLPADEEALLFLAIEQQQKISIRAGRYFTEINYSGYDKACKRFK